MDKDLENWLYRPIYPEEEFFKKVEAALGFKLFIWQKAFIGGTLCPQHINPVLLR